MLRLAVVYHNWHTNDIRGADRVVVETGTSEESVWDTAAMLWRTTAATVRDHSSNNDGDDNIDNDECSCLLVMGYFFSTSFCSKLE